ncbi:MAG: hypothetical protein CVT92_02865 [Bacteroidetes bacterium HGW-Bacteroidetes-1]|nr:MAG: hypothetical protein CVT92_02865 [Bacteroidetes bacterium HGW-Bacteroidetes-1]
MQFMMFMESAAQNLPETVNYDSLTYQLYMKGSWKELLRTGNRMPAEGMDYYYLRMRTGIAAMQVKDYAQAEKHFRKALSFNPMDKNAVLFLAQTLAANNKNVESGSLYRSMSTQSRKESGLKEGWVPISAHVDIGAVFRNKKNGLGFDDLTGSAGVYGQERIYKNNLFYDAGLYFKTNPQWLFYAGFQSIGIDVTDRFAFIESSLTNDSIIVSDAGKAYYYSVDTIHKTNNYEHQLKQQSAYFQAQWSSSTKWSLVAGLHVLSVKSDFTLTEEERISINDTAFYNNNTGQVELFNTYLEQVSFYNVPWKTYDINVSLNGKLHFGKFTALAGISTGSINDSSVFQANTGFLYMPFGNLNTFNQTEFFALHTNGQVSWAAKTRFGIQPLKSTWLEAEIFAGALNNLNDQYGYIIYNNPDKLNLRFEATLSKALTDRVIIQIRYRYMESERQFSHLDDSGNDLILGSYHINSQTIIGGIKWIF